jgi:alkylation response protein AidB-like acyl-CoA dehydrogenase
MFKENLGATGGGQRAASESGAFVPPVASISRALSVSGFFEFCQRNRSDLDEDTTSAILRSAGFLLAKEFSPLNRVGDLNGAKLGAEGVRATSGFASAYHAFVRGGWNSLSAPAEYGGQGLPKALEFAVFEMAQAANASLALCPMLTQGAIDALARHGSPRQRSLILPKMISGAWTGTMNLTEPQAGTDLGSVTTRAVPDGAGGYRLTGQKIFISWGDHDIAENICHLVLARLPDAPAGTGGVSLFLATKVDVLEDGTLGARNGVRCGSLEEKLGIHGSPTCVMLFDDARAELVGEAGKGVAQMFTMMNSARLHIGVQGVGLAERAYQQALAFALERRQGRTALGGSGTIVDHPDVRRMLGLMKAKTEAARAICIEAAVQSDWARFGCKEASARNNVLTPIAKAWSTDTAVEVASLGVQIHGGMGFVEETGAAQYFRDARIGPIYEGTNGVQAVDLVGRKLSADGGQAIRQLIDRIEQQSHPALRASGGALRRATDWISIHPGADALAGATKYLELAGNVLGGDLLWRQAQADGDGARLAIFNIFASQVLSASSGLAAAIMAGAQDLRDWRPS